MAALTARLSVASRRSAFLQMQGIAILQQPHQRNHSFSARLHYAGCDTPADLTQLSPLASTPNAGRGSQASSSGRSPETWHRIGMQRGFGSYHTCTASRSVGSPGSLSHTARLDGLFSCWHRRSVSMAAVIDRDSQLPRLLEGDPEAGLLVEFRKVNKTGLALITEKDGKRNWKAVDTRGTVHSLRPREIAFVLPGSQYKEADLLRIKEIADSLAADHGIMQDAWEVIGTDKETFFDVTEMADLLFNDTSPAYCYASHRLLNEDRTFFKQVGRLPPKFAARSQLDVSAVKGRQQAELKRAEQRLEQQNARAAAFGVAMTAPYGEKPTEDEWLKGPWAAEIQALREYALTEQDPDATFTFPEGLLDVMKPFTKGSLRASAAAELLKQLGVWGLHDHLPLLRAGITPSFDAYLIAEADALLADPPQDPDAGHRLDLTHLHSYAIDSAETKDVDDAISLEQLEDGTARIWVHIADATRYIRPGCPLDREAARRALTLYLPTGNVPMFPRQLSEQLFSLQHGKASPAFSIWIRLDTDGRLADSGMTCSHIKTTRMTYQELNSMLGESSAGHADITTLSQLAQLRRRWREQRGALTQQFPDCQIAVSNSRVAMPSISLKPDDTSNTPANLFVSELMILANEAVGKFGSARSLPLPYRGQAEMQPFTPEELEQAPEGICRMLLMRSRLTRSVATVSAPLPHYSLGLETYVQTTSPIRRYGDLLTHWQLKAILRGDEPPFAADPLSELVSEASLRQREYKIYNRDIDRYWQILYFQQLLRDEPDRVYEAVLGMWIKQDAGAALAVLSDSFINVKVWLPQPYALGTKLRLHCSEADPFNQQLEFREASAYSGLPAAEALTDSSQPTEEVEEAKSIDIEVAEVE